MSLSYPPCSHSLWNVLPLLLDMPCAWHAEETKLAAHGEECWLEGVNFIPPVLESLGGWGQDLIDVVKAIGCLQARRLGCGLVGGYPLLAQKISSSLLKVNATLWTTPQHPYPTSVDGIL